MPFNVYTRDQDGIHLVHQGANYRQAEIYRSQSVNIECHDVGADPYEESRAKERERNLEAEQEARRIADRHFTLATCDHFGSF